MIIELSVGLSSPYDKQCPLWWEIFFTFTEVLGSALILEFYFINESDVLAWNETNFWNKMFFQIFPDPKFQLLALFSANILIITWFGGTVIPYKM